MSGKMPGWDTKVCRVLEFVVYGKKPNSYKTNDAVKSRAKTNPAMPVGEAPEFSVGSVGL